MFIHLNLQIQTIFSNALFSDHLFQDPVEDDDDLPKQLKCAIKYDFTKNTIILCFSGKELKWKKVSIQGVYHSADKNIPIIEDQFEYVEIENECIYNFIGKQAKFSKMFKIALDKIDRHVFWHQFSVTIGYIFLEDVDMKHFGTEYTFNVSKRIILTLSFR
jgi:hypothetical protein